MVAVAQISSLGLARVPLLAGLPTERLNQLAGCCAWRWYEAGQMMMSRASTGSEVHLIVEGRVRIHVYAADGREVLLTHVREGSIVGDFAAVDGGPRTTDAHATTKVLSACMLAADFKRLLREEPLVEERYVRYLVGLVRTLTDRVIELSTLAVQNRIRAELLRLARTATQGEAARLDPAPRHADLAAQVGTTREQVTRELSLLARQGLLARSGSALLLNDVPRLQELVRSAGEVPVRTPPGPRTPARAERYSPQ
jgi:CRP-like cAMP-binding protein